ncbi:hypothetical protein, partial [Micromonospora marina]|uniref:hypothetical protein n=1 Tax=Micromonospora marina TaxID=307120 RepID=UPI003451C86B
MTRRKRRNTAETDETRPGNPPAIASPVASYGVDLPGGRVFANSEELLRYLTNEDVKFVDVRFCD